MSHELKSPSLGMISMATRTTATVSPLTPSPVNGAALANGSLASQSSHSGFAAALRKLAKQAEEPRGSASISSESSPVSSPATNHSSPVSTPKRGPMGPVLIPAGSHSVPGTPPVVTIAPTKTSNGLWRSEGRQMRVIHRVTSRDRLVPDAPEKSGLSIPHHLVGAPFSLGLSPNTVMQDPRLQAFNLPRQVPHMLPVGAVLSEEYLRGLRVYSSAEDLRLPSLPLGLDPNTAAATAAYLHSGYLPHPNLSSYRMDESMCLSALRAQFCPLPAGGALPALHPSALHFHLSGTRVPGDLAHPALMALQSERLQMEDELRQQEKEREREREREKERLYEVEREREFEREREKEREKEKERDREMERQKERAKEREIQAVRAMEKRFLNQELQAHRQQTEERAKMTERLTPNCLDKTKEVSLPPLKPLQPGFCPSLPTPRPSLPAMGSSTVGHFVPGALQGFGEEERWPGRQRAPRQEKEAFPGLGCELRGQVLDQHPGPGRSRETMEPPDLHQSNSNQRDSSNREPLLHLAAPPPLISPKPHPPLPPTTLWNPISLIETTSDSRRAYELHTPPLRPPPTLTKPGRVAEETGRRQECPERYPVMPGHSLLEPGTFLTELEKSTQSFLSQQRASLALRPQPSQYAELRVTQRASSPCRGLQGPSPVGPNPMLVCDEVLQPQRGLVSKLDLEEKRRREAREKGHYYELDESFDESDEEEVRAHLRRVARQPPLKLDESAEKVEFLRVFGLTTHSQRDELLWEKRRKRRRMMMERSPSPPAVQGKRQTPPALPLTTHFSAEEMDSTPLLDDKKRFLSMFSLTHISTQQRREREKLIDLLQAIRQRSVTLDTQLPDAGSSSSTAFPLKSLDSGNCRDTLKVTTSPPKHPSPLLPHLEQSQLGEPNSIKRIPSLLPAVPSPPRLKEQPAGQNGRTHPWESFTAEEFAQHFHQSVLQSTQKALQRPRGGATAGTEPNHRIDSSVHYNISDLQGVPNQVLHSQTNGHTCPLLTNPNPPGAQHEVWDEEDSSDEDDEEEQGSSSRWQGIEAIFEAYQEYMEERSIEYEVLQGECRRLEVQHYNLTVAAEQLSHSMAELLAQKQRMSLERERMHSELEHIRTYLALPTLPWHRGHVNGKSLR
ncbi:genetic suppressor element 1-like [Chanos chanos]|uniref:Genetic suppressor element 1-like n=1 Tax=Chanos chanos TaxID=29144 RepID=A0A6J2UM49_CHACN|nr:genetic suppressor element 1-like [Chanos chanos]